MRFSTTLIAVSSSLVALLACSSALLPGASAALTPQERLETEARDPTNPNYCPDCLKKALVNHFPHACPADLKPMEAITRPTGPTPAERRCICIAFLDLYWMKADCSLECSFVHDPEAMKGFLSAKSIPGCDQWVDFEASVEKDIEGFEKKDPGYAPEVFEQVAPPADAVAQDEETPEANADAEAVEMDENQEEAVINFSSDSNSADSGDNEENGPKITIKVENFIRNPDGSIPDYALEEMAAAEAEAKAKAEAEVETKAKDEL